MLRFFTTFRKESTEVHRENWGYKSSRKRSTFFLREREFKCVYSGCRFIKSYWGEGECAKGGSSMRFLPKGPLGLRTARCIEDRVDGESNYHFLVAFALLRTWPRYLEHIMIHCLNFIKEIKRSCNSLNVNITPYNFIEETLKSEAKWRKANTPIVPI